MFRTSLDRLDGRNYRGGIFMPRGRSRKTNEAVLLRSAEMIGWAIGGIEREIHQTRERLAALTAQAARLRTRLGARGAKGAAALSSAALTLGEAAQAGVKRRRKMSKEGRKRISEMMTKRWAEHRKAKAKAKAAKAAK
jgi:hypothetical protein